jgi:Tol biopolymer transport system component
MRASPGGKIEQLTRSKAGVSNYLPQVSPHSQWVVFASTCTGSRQLYVARADGTGVYPITRLEADGAPFHAYWRPKP